jgi:hypothetical protein
MGDISDLFWSASIEEIKNGYILDFPSGKYVCLICGAEFEKGIIYEKNGTFMEAEKAVKNHITTEHGSAFEYLIDLDKKITGLTDHQKSLMNCFYQGLNDKEIVEKTDIGSESTIRNHRFAFRQREKQAKVFLALMGLLEESKNMKKQGFVSIHRTAKMVDERYAITQEENDEVLKKYFEQGLDGPLSEFPKKEKRKIVILKNLTRRFDANKKYTEKEVNEILLNAFPDFVTLRRYLIEYGFLDRERDGSSYWVKV